MDISKPKKTKKVEKKKRSKPSFELKPHLTHRPFRSDQRLEALKNDLLNS